MIAADGLLGPAWAGTAADEATADRAVHRALLDAEAALARAQNRPDLAARITSMAESGGEGRTRHSGGNPVIPLVRTLPEGAHDGATSQDILDTALMLVAARTRRVILRDLAATATALEALARTHRDTPMPGRTLTQHAVPTTFGLKATGWRSLVVDAHERLAEVTLPAQLGGAGGTLATLSVPLMERFAQEAGLAAPLLPWHTLRTPVADLAGALAFCCGALGKIAADVLVLSRTEIAEVTEGDGGGSSAMPHKSNPVHATLIAACARQAPQLAATLYGALAAEDERPAGAWHAEWEPLRTLLRLSGGAAFHARALAEGLQVHPARMRENLSLTGGLIVAERVLSELSRKIGNKAARDILETASRDAARLRMPLIQALDADLDPALFDPTGYSGAAGELVDRALDRPLKEIADVELPR
ncbi:lyase family protein [Herbidospora sp. RD11066]